MGQNVVDGIIIFAALAVVVALAIVTGWLRDRRK